MHEIAVRHLYKEVTLDVGSPNDMKLSAFLNPKNIGLPYIRELDLYLADVVDKCNQLQQAHFAIRMILELLPQDILEKFSWHPWSPFSGDNLVLLYKKQRRLKWLEAIALDKNVLSEIQKIPDFKNNFSNTRKLGLYPDTRDVLDFCQFLVVNSNTVEKITLHASFDEGDTALPARELNDSSTGPGLITSTMFSHMLPFNKCVPLALKEITLQKIHLRYAASTYCKIINFRTVKSIRLFACPGADALLAELSSSTMLPEKLETFEFKHTDNAENDGLSALDGFLCLVSGIKVLTVDITYAKSLPGASSICRHHKTLEELNVHVYPLAEESEEELHYDQSSFSQICNQCTRIEQISVAFPHRNILRQASPMFQNFEVSLQSLFPSCNPMLTLTFLELLGRFAKLNHVEHYNLAPSPSGNRLHGPIHLRTTSKGRGPTRIRAQYRACKRTRP